MSTTFPQKPDIFKFSCLKKNANVDWQATRRDLFLSVCPHRKRLASCPMAHKYRPVCVNVFSSGSPSRMRRVRRISFGMTILPRSSTRRTIPVAFIVFLSLCCISSGIVCRKWGIMREDSHAQTYNGFFVDKQRFFLEITKRPIYTIIGNV